MPYEFIFVFYLIFFLFFFPLIYLFRNKQLLEHTGANNSPSQTTFAHSTDSYNYAKYEFFCLRFGKKNCFCFDFNPSNFIFIHSQAKILEYVSY